MFNMERAGQTISRLRKECNMTQMELADKLGISFQAVSNWERGNTMPDIGKLPELAQIFGVTTDELLGESSGLLSSAVRGDLEAYMEENPDAVAEFVQTVPLLKPEQADAGFEKITGEKPLPDFGEIEEILPFISRSLINELAQKYAESSELGHIVAMAPFADREVLDEIAETLDRDGKNIVDLAPFLSKERINGLAQKYADSSERGRLGDIAPFVDRGFLNRIAVSLSDEGKEIDDIAPFIDRKVMDEIAEKLAGKGKNIGNIMPFVSGEGRRKIAEYEYGKNGLRNFEDIAPFLDKAFLSGLAKEAIEKHGIKAISPIVPFLDKGMLSEYISSKYL